jgi:DNA repair protein RecO
VHHIYTNPAFIVHSSPYGEAGKFLLLFTKDFGMIGAVAQGIRLTQSKLRYHIQDFNLSMVSIVRGKEVWRLTGAHEIESENEDELSQLQIKILKLLKRLLHGEEKNEKLFEIVEELYKNKIKKDEEDLVECLIVLRVLNTLGYIKNTEELSIFLENKYITAELIELIKQKKMAIIDVINSALKESQL